MLGPELDLGPPEQFPPAAAVLEVWDGLRVVSCFGGADVISGSWADPVLEVDGAEHRRESLARAATYRRARPCLHVNVRKAGVFLRETDGLPRQSLTPGQSTPGKTPEHANCP